MWNAAVGAVSAASDALTLRFSGGALRRPLQRLVLPFMRGYPSQLVKRRKWTGYTRKVNGILPIVSIRMNALKRGAECVTFAEISIPEFCN